jgi:hypothetical protein
MLDELNKKVLPEFIVLYKNIWADNGDQLSQLYAGTDCITSELTREGK